MMKYNQLIKMSHGIDNETLSVVKNRKNNVYNNKKWIIYAFISIIFPTVTNFAYVNDNYGRNIAKWFIELNIGLCILYMITFPFQMCCNIKIKPIIRHFSIFVTFVMFVNNISYLSYINKNKSTLIEEINLFNYENKLDLYKI